MKVNLPLSECPQMRITMRVSGWSNRTFVKPPYGVCELVIPSGIDIRGVEVTAEGCDLAGRPVERVTFLKRPTYLSASVPTVQLPEPPKPKPRKKRAKRGHEIAQPVELTDLDNTRSQVNVVDDERDAG